MYINAPKGLPFKMISHASFNVNEASEESAPSRVIKPVKEHLVEEDIEEIIVHDMSFITYTPDSYLMQHQSYAGIEFKFSHINAVDLNMETRVYAADELQIRLFKEPKEQQENVDEIKFVEPSSDPDIDEWTKSKKPETPSQINTTPKNDEESEAPAVPEIPCIDVLGNNLHLIVYEDRITIQTQLRKYGCDANTLIVHDAVELKLEFSQSLSEIFRQWVEEMNSFINCFCPKRKTLYFLETHSTDCRKKGFELMKAVPPLGKYNFCAGNYFIDVDELSSINSRLTNKFNWYEKDMLKFPRFPLYKRGPSVVNFPMVLSTQVFVEIPAQLANTDRIHQFIDPFDRIKFRKLKHRFNEAVLFHLHPRLRILVQQEISKRSWRNHHQEHKRRRFMEQQRLSLYMAMLKHKVYPNYFQFKDQFYNHVRNIDFFEFMASKCSEKANPEHYQVPPQLPEESETSKAEANVVKGKKRRKCLCPKYLKSMQK